MSTPELQQALDDVDKWKRLSRKSEDRAKKSHQLVIKITSTLEQLLDEVDDEVNR